MDPITAGLIFGGTQFVTGLLQRRAARRRRKEALEGFEYEIPSAVEEQVQLARERASRRGLPGEDITRSRLESDIARTVEQGESVADSTQDVLGLYGKAYGQRGDYLTRLLEMGAKEQASREMELDRSLRLLADAENQQFHYNRYVPFMSEMGFAGQQSAGGAQNIMSGAQTAYSAWANDWMMEQYKGLYANNKEDGMNSLPQFKLNMPGDEDPVPYNEIYDTSANPFKV